MNGLTFSKLISSTVSVSDFLVVFCVQSYKSQKDKKKKKKFCKLWAICQKERAFFVALRGCLWPFGFGWGGNHHFFSSNTNVTSNTMIQIRKFGIRKIHIRKLFSCRWSSQYANFGTALQEICASGTIVNYTTNVNSPT